jgi:hypothetical protein
MAESYMASRNPSNANGSAITHPWAELNVSTCSKYDQSKSAPKSMLNMSPRGVSSSMTGDSVSVKMCSLTSSSGCTALKCPPDIQYPFPQLLRLLHDMELVPSGKSGEIKHEPGGQLLSFFKLSGFTSDIRFLAAISASAANGPRPLKPTLRVFRFSVARPREDSNGGPGVNGDDGGSVCFFGTGDFGVSSSLARRGEGGQSSRDEAKSSPPRPCLTAFGDSDIPAERGSGFECKPLRASRWAYARICFCVRVPTAAAISVQARGPCSSYAVANRACSSAVHVREPEAALAVEDSLLTFTNCLGVVAEQSCKALCQKKSSAVSTKLVTINKGPLRPQSVDGQYQRRNQQLKC